MIKSCKNFKIFATLRLFLITKHPNLLRQCSFVTRICISNFLINIRNYFKKILQFSGANFSNFHNFLGGENFFVLTFANFFWGWGKEMPMKKKKSRTKVTIKYVLLGQTVLIYDDHL